jgi:hypothetical protein
MKARRVDDADTIHWTCPIDKSTMFTTQLPARPEPQPVDSAADLALCFLRLANLPNFALERLSRYEAILWLGIRQTPPADGLDDYRAARTMSAKSCLP